MLPRSIEPGAHVRLVSVSAPEPVTAADWLERGIAQLRTRYEVSEAPSLRGQLGYLSAAPTEMASDLHAACSDPNVDAVLCAAGGSNANRVLRHLDFDLIAEARKPIVGVSNPTLLLAAITQQTGLVTIHGPAVVWDFGAPDGPNPATMAAGYAALEGRFDEGMQVGCDDWRALRSGVAEGRLVAGNLTSLQALIGTPWEPQWAGAILAWEDVAKPVHRLDLMLTHFADAGVLDAISGMVVGQLVECPPQAGVELESMLEEVVGDRGFPVMTNVPFGHTALKASLPIGASVRLDGTERTLHLS